MPEWYDTAYMSEQKEEAMPNQVKSQDIMPLLEKMSDQQITAAADELHAFVAHRRSNATKSGAQKAPFNAGNFFKNFLQVVQAIWPVIQPLIAGQSSTQSANP